jgi:hypothetical protein
VDANDTNDGVKLKKNMNKKQHLIEVKDSSLTFALYVPKKLRLFCVDSLMEKCPKLCLCSYVHLSPRFFHAGKFIDS